MSETPADVKKKINDIADQVITAGHVVSNTLGSGFVEKVYENALAWELRRLGMKVEQKYPIVVRYQSIVAGEFTADMVIDDLVIVELKAAKAFDDIHMAQCLNYLRATGLKLCLLMNFGTPRMEYRRIVNRL